ncbi:hypothetical protein Goarm_015555, partial [Gossypium armourianum]|nr:hypothetical protein [Gossypium armourianum]
MVTALLHFVVALQFLNTNHTLYNAVKKAEQDGHLLTEEARRAALHLRIDFEKGGIHLPSGKLDRVNQLNMDAHKLCREYGENIINDPGYVDIFPASRIPRQIQHLLKPIYRLTSGVSKESLGSYEDEQEKGFRIITEPRTLFSVLQLTPDEQVRKMAYLKGNSVPHANHEVLDKLINSRHELAQLVRKFEASLGGKCPQLSGKIMGCKSYAEFVMQLNMASSPEVVVSFLQEMSNMVKEKADEEFNTIRNLKRDVCGQRCVDLEPWDEAYYTTMMKSSAYNLDSAV